MVFDVRKRKTKKVNYVTKRKYTEKEGSTQRYYFNLEFEWIRIEVKIKTLKANLIKITCMIITYI